MSLATFIEDAFERRAEFSPKSAPQDVRDAVNEALALLDSGAARVAEKIDGEWQVNQWLKKAVLLSFRLNPRLALELAEVCVESGLTPSALVRDMVEKSLRIRFHVAPKGGQGEQAK